MTIHTLARREEHVWVRDRADVVTSMEAIKVEPSHSSYINSCKSIKRNKKEKQRHYKVHTIDRMSTVKKKVKREGPSEVSARAQVYVTRTMLWNLFDDITQANFLGIFM